MRLLLTADPELPVPPALYGGIERVVDILARGLAERGHSVGLAAHRSSTSTPDDFFPWPGARSQASIDVFRNSLALRAAVSDFKPDLVHSFSRVLYLTSLLRSSMPKVMSYQRPPSARTIKYGAKLGHGSLTFTGCSEHISEQIRSAGGVATTIYNCVELDKYAFRPRVASDAPLLFLSRVERIKGAHTAIEVARRLNRRLLIAGNHSASGEDGRYWNEEIKPRLGEGIEYVGAVNDAEKSELLGQALGLVVPIEWDEPFGIVFTESLACGTPIVSCPRGALPEIVRDGVDGFLVNSVAEACEAVERLPSLDRSNCRRRIEECFASNVILDRYERLYRSLLQANGNGAGTKDGE